MESKWLNEQLKTIRNLCDTGLILSEQNREALLPTVLELILVEAQNMVDDYCVVNEAGV